MRRSLLGGLAVLSLLFAACGGDDDGDSDAGGGSGGSGADATAETTEVTEPDPVADTRPGEERVALGEAIEFEDDTLYDETVTVRVTVTALEPTTMDVITGEGVQVEDTDQVPYFVRFTLEKVSDGTATGVRQSSFIGITSDGSGATSLNIIGEFAPCQAEELPEDAPAGTTLEQCDVMLVEPGVELVGVSQFPEGAEAPVSWVAA